MEINGDAGAAAEQDDKGRATTVPRQRSTRARELWGQGSQGNGGRGSSG